MVWQDLLISFANVLMGIALVPQVIKGFKSKKSSVLPLTSGTTSFGLFLMTISFFSLKLYFSFVVAFICFVLWVILLFQGLRANNF